MLRIPAYYLDEPLSREDCAFIVDFLAEREGIAPASIVVQTRVPCVLPTFTDDSQRDAGADIELLKKHLIRAGMRKDAGTQIVWVMPRDTAWGARFQITIFEITGFYPYVLQRWSPDKDGSMYLRDTRIIDGHGMMGGKS